jgi:hypothetical protein
MMKLKTLGLFFIVVTWQFSYQSQKKSKEDIIVEVLDFLMGYESYLRKRRMSVSSRRYKPTEKRRHSLC